MEGDVTATTSDGEPLARFYRVLLSEFTVFWCRTDTR